jgi:PAS domain S-box-containing protein
MFGWSTADSVGARATRVFTADDQLSERLHFEMSQAEAGGHFKNERLQLRKDGGQFWASIETMPLRGDDGRLQCYVRLVWDRTQHRLGGERLRQTQDRFQTLLDTVDTAFAIVEVKFDAGSVPVDCRFLEAQSCFWA